MGGGGVIKGENWHFQFSPKSYPLSEVTAFLPFKHQSHKMVKHAQTIGQIADELFEGVWPLC